MLGIEHPAIYVSDLEKSIEFYKKLGFKILRKTASPHAMMYQPSSNDIIEIIPRLEQNKKDGFKPPFPYHIGFYTDDLDGWIKRLNAEGIKTTPVNVSTRTTLANGRSRIVEHPPEIEVANDLKLFGNP
jgi:catechol 2,3-dioxygenase-like lactoylglutathione lyase family enzyme